MADTNEIENQPGIHKVPWSVDSQLTSQYYFYSDYDPATHFEYRIPFLEDGITPDMEELNRDYDPVAKKSGGPKIQAFAEALEYHLSFEQVLPAENTDYVQFYKPKYNNEFKPQDYEGIADKNYVGIDEQTLLNQLDKLPIKTALIEKLREDRGLDADYSEMTMAQLQNLYEKSQLPEQFNVYGDATRWNMHCYNCATYCRVERPMKVECYKDNGEWVTKVCQLLDSNGNRAIYSTPSEVTKYTDTNGNEITNNYGNYPKMTYVSAYEFRKYIRLINSTFGTKIPVEEGWYRYNKVTKKWEFVCDIEPTTHLNYEYYGDGAQEANSNG